METEKLHILMAAMAMDIGGAETHIVALSRELVRRGHRVTVVSAGGVYVRELVDSGVTHAVIPMHRRSLPGMIKAYFRMKKLIKTEKPDIVHAHARIPAFLCRLIRKTQKFRFVTTAHGIFPSGGLPGILTDWGEKTIAVSEDIQAYLTENYQIPKSDIFVTINGIDTNRFSPDTDREAVRRELGIPENAPVIVHVSRLDEGRVKVAAQLIELAPALCESAAGLCLIIAGGGNRFEALARKADEANRLAGRQCVYMTGPRTDIDRVIAAGDIFTGASRAALEAMGVSVPVIVAVDEGYAGLFTEDKLNACREVNFCCRGCPQSEPEALMRDLLACLDRPQAERDALGAYGRRVVLEEYSVNRMTDVCLSAYAAVLAPTRHILISGYYGFRNAGDEAILESMLESIRALPQSTRVTVLSADPAYTVFARDVRAVYRFGLVKIWKAVGHCDLLISGGGSLFQDRTSTRSLLYYLSIIRLAKLRGKRVLMYANGIGPVTKKINRKRIKKTVEKADFITLREEGSLAELRAIGITREDLHVTADPVFSIQAWDQETSKALLSRITMSGDRPVAGISVRALNADETAYWKLAALCDYIYEELGMDILFLVMQAPGDTTASERVRDHMKCPAIIMEGEWVPKAIMSVAGVCAFVLAMRLHTLLFAAKQRVPVVGVVCDPKIDYYLEKLDMPAAGRVEDLDLAHMKALVEDIAKNRDSYTARLDAAVIRLEEAAGLNQALLEQAIG